MRLHQRSAPAETRVTLHAAPQMRLAAPQTGRATAQRKPTLGDPRSGLTPIVGRGTPFPPCSTTATNPSRSRNQVVVHSPAGLPSTPPTVELASSAVGRRPLTYWQ